MVEESVEEMKTAYKEWLDRYNSSIIEFRDAVLKESSIGYVFEAMVLEQYARGLSVEGCRLHVLATKSGMDAMNNWRLASQDKLAIEAEMKLAAANCNYYFALLVTHCGEI